MCEAVQSDIKTRVWLETPPLICNIRRHSQATWCGVMQSTSISLWHISWPLGSRSHVGRFFLGHSVVSFKNGDPSRPRYSGHFNRLPSRLAP